MYAFPSNASKVLVYDSIATLNRDFEQVLSDLERLEGLGVFPRRWQRKFLKVWRATLEETRAWVNFEVVEILHQREEREWVHFGRIRRRSEKSPEPDMPVPTKAGAPKSQRPKVTRKRDTGSTSTFRSAKYSGLP